MPTSNMGDLVYHQTRKISMEYHRELQNQKSPLRTGSVQIFGRDPIRQKSFRNSWKINVIGHKMSLLDRMFMKLGGNVS